MTSEPLNQYTEICRDAIKSSSAKLSKTFENLLLEILLLYITIQRKINFTQMERYGVPISLDVPRHLTEKSITRNLTSHACFIAQYKYFIERRIRRDSASINNIVLGYFYILLISSSSCFLQIKVPIPEKMNVKIKAAWA